MKVTGYHSPFCEPARECEETEAGIERMMKAVYGGMDPEEIADLKVRQRERNRLRREKAVRESQALLREAGRPVCRRDMISAMNQAIMNRTAAFEKIADARNAILLLATVICRNILLDGPLHEE